MESWELSLYKFSPQASALCGGTSSLNLPWCHFFLSSCFLSIYLAFYLACLPFLPFFFLPQAKVKLIIFLNFLSPRFLPQRLHLWCGARKMWLKCRQSEYLCLTKWAMFFPFSYRYMERMAISLLIKSRRLIFTLLWILIWCLGWLHIKSHFELIQGKCQLEANGFTIQTAT